MRRGQRRAADDPGIEKQSDGSSALIPRVVINQKAAPEMYNDLLKVPRKARPERIRAVYAVGLAFLKSLDRDQAMARMPVRPAFALPADADPDSDGPQHSDPDPEAGRAAVRLERAKMGGPKF